MKSNYKAVIKQKEETKPVPHIEISTENTEVPSAGEMVEQAFTAAVVATVANNEKVQSEIVEGAEKVIQNKTSAIKAQAEMEAKEAHFNNKKNACECFGYNETTTERWAVTLMGFWHSVITAVWIVIGMFTFAPVTFVAKKISVIFKKAWVAVLVAIVIYLVIALSPFWVRLVASLNGGV